jgi:hypothetical protein
MKKSLNLIRLPIAKAQAQLRETERSRAVARRTRSFSRGRDDQDPGEAAPALYYIGYDATLDRRAELEDVLRNWDGVSLYDGAWLVKRPLSALEIRNALQTFLGEDDPVIVLELKLGSWWASEHVACDGLEWLKANVLA